MNHGPRAPNDLESRRDFVVKLALGIGGVPIGAGVLASLPMLSATAGCGARSGDAAKTVVAYTSVDDALARVVLEACRRATGIDVVAVFDTEATKTTGLENRVRAEANRPRADLFWSSEAFACARLAADRLLRPIPPDILEGWPAAHRDPDGRWIAFSARARVVAFRRDRDARPPATWGELAFGGVSSGSEPPRIAIADPRFGTTRGHVAALDAAWSAARARGIDAPHIELWADALRARGVRVLAGGNAATVDAVAAGEVDFGFTDTDDVFAAQARGLPIDFTLPRTLAPGVGGGGTMIVPNTMGIVSGREERPEVLEVLRWIVGAEGERLLCASASRNIPLGPHAATVSASCATAFEEPDPLAFDLAAAARQADALAARVHARLTGSG
jgi:iron(III) transport system substrate-binding protein